MQPVLSSHGQRCPGVISFSLSRVLLEGIGHCTPLLNHCRGELTSWDASVCWLLERVHRCICLSASLPWFLLLSFLATIGAAYPGIRFFRTLCRILWTYQHLFFFLIPFCTCLSLFLSFVWVSPAIWEEHCELDGVGLSFIKTGKTVCLVLQCIVFGDELFLVALPMDHVLGVYFSEILGRFSYKVPSLPRWFHLVKRGFRLPEHS